MLNLIGHFLTNYKTIILRESQTNIQHYILGEGLGFNNSFGNRKMCLEIYFYVNNIF